MVNRQKNYQINKNVCCILCFLYSNLFIFFLSAARFSRFSSSTPNRISYIKEEGWGLAGKKRKRVMNKLRTTLKSLTKASIHMCKDPRGRWQQCHWGSALYSAPVMKKNRRTGFYFFSIHYVRKHKISLHKKGWLKVAEALWCPIKMTVFTSISDVLQHLKNHHGNILSAHHVCSCHEAHICSPMLNFLNRQK